MAEGPERKTDRRAWKVDRLEYGQRGQKGRGTGREMAEGPGRKMARKEDRQQGQEERQTGRMSEGPRVNTD